MDEIRESQIEKRKDHYGWKTFNFIVHAVWILFYYACLVFVVPGFQVMYEGDECEKLPLLTRGIVLLSHYARGCWFVSSFAVAVLLILHARIVYSLPWKKEGMSAYVWCLVVELFLIAVFFVIAIALFLPFRW